MVDAQRDFVADASHQLRTPLTGLRLRLEEAAATADGPALEQIDGALGEVDRLSGVVTELLVLERGGRGAAARRGDRPAGRGATGGRAYPASTSSCPGSSSVVRCTVDDLDRILDALIENAIHYGPPGRGSRCVVAPGRLEVADEGPGLAPGEEETIFARFHRGAVGRASRRRGTGLGLAIARELAGALARRRRAGQRRAAAARWRRSRCRWPTARPPTNQ